MEHFFPPNLKEDLRSDAQQSQIIGGEADVDHTQVIGGGIQSTYLGDISPHLPGFRYPCSMQGSRIQEQVFSKNKTKKKFFKNFFQAISKKAKKKVRANFLQGLWHFPTKF